MESSEICNLVVDCETLGTSDNAIVLSVCAMAITPAQTIGDALKNNQLAIFKLSVDDQKSRGRTTDPSTIEFWSKQPDDLRLATLNPDASKDLNCNDFAIDFVEFLNMNGVNSKRSICICWQRGTKDYDWISSVINGSEENINLPINWWNVREIRTAIDVLGYSSRLNGYMDDKYLSEKARHALSKLVKHNARSDVLRDAIYLRVAGLI